MHDDGDVGGRELDTPPSRGAASTGTNATMSSASSSSIWTGNSAPKPPVATAPDAPTASASTTAARRRNDSASPTVSDSVSVERAGSWRTWTGVCDAGTSRAAYSSSTARCVAARRSSRTAPCSRSTFLVVSGSLASRIWPIASSGTSRARSRRMTAASVSWAIEYER
jgi:hypothetical protein